MSLFVLLFVGALLIPSTSVAATSVDCNEAFDDLRTYLESGNGTFYTPKIDAWVEAETTYWGGWSLTQTYHGEIRESGLTVESSNFWSTLLVYVGMTGTGDNLPTYQYTYDSLTLERHLGEDPQVSFDIPNQAADTVTPTSCTRYNDPGIDATYFMTVDNGSTEYTFGFQTVTDDPTPPSYLILQVRDANGDLVGSRSIPSDADASQNVGPVFVDPYGTYDVISWAYDSDGLKRLSLSVDDGHTVSDDRITHEDESRDPPRRLDLRPSVNEALIPNDDLTVSATASNFDDITARTGKIIIEAYNPRPLIDSVNGRDPQGVEVDSQPVNNPSGPGSTETLTIEGDHLGGEGARTMLMFEATENHRIWPFKKWRDDQKRWVSVYDPDNDGLNQRVTTVVPEYYQNYSGQLRVHVRKYAQENNPNGDYVLNGFVLDHMRRPHEYPEDTCDMSGTSYYTGDDLDSTNSPDDFRVEAANAPADACANMVELHKIHNPGNDGCDMSVTLHDSSIGGNDRIAQWSWIEPHTSMDVSGVYLNDDTYFTLSLNRSDSGCGNTGDYATVGFDWTSN